jgi:hypothetical protein
MAGSSSRILPLLLLGFGALTSKLPAQDSVRVAGIGSRVRLGLFDSTFPPVIGVLADLGRDSLIVVSGRWDRVMLARSNVRTVQVSIDRKPDYLRGAGTGAAAGAVAGGMFLVIYALALPRCDDLPPPTQLTFDFEPCFTPDASNIAAALGISSALGAMTGLVVASRSPRDRWIDGRLEGDAPAVVEPKARILLGVGSRAGRPDLRTGLRLRVGLARSHHRHRELRRGGDR